MQSAASLTFAIPFYSNCDYLRRALESVRRQTRSDWICIVVDDCGPEPEAAALVESLGDPRISYMRYDQNAGLAGNWNRCLDLVKTPLATILHADDELMPNYADLMTKAAERYPDAAAIFCDAQIIDARSQPKFSFPDYIKSWIKPKADRELILEGDSGLAAILKGNFIMCPTLCYRLAALESQRFDPSWGMVLDLDFIAKLLFRGRRLIGLPQVGYAYRRHGGNQTSLLTENRKRFEEEMSIYLEIATRAGTMGWVQAHRVGAQAQIIKLHLGYQTFKHLLTGQAKEVSKDLKMLARTYRRKPRLNR